MSLHNPGSDAEWLLETIIDDFAQSLSRRDRVRFYAELADLVVQRRDTEEQLAAEPDGLPNVPPRVH